MYRLNFSADHRWSLGHEFPEALTEINVSIALHCHGHPTSSKFFHLLFVHDVILGCNYTERSVPRLVSKPTKHPPRTTQHTQDATDVKHLLPTSRTCQATRRYRRSCLWRLTADKDRTTPSVMWGWWLECCCLWARATAWLICIDVSRSYRHIQPSLQSDKLQAS